MFNGVIYNHRHGMYTTSYFETLTLPDKFFQKSTFTNYNTISSANFSKAREKPLDRFLDQRTLSIFQYPNTLFEHYKHFIMLRHQYLEKTY